MQRIDQVALLVAPDFWICPGNPLSTHGTHLSFYELHGNDTHSRQPGNPGSVSEIYAHHERLAPEWIGSSRSFVFDISIVSPGALLAIHGHPARFAGNAEYSLSKQTLIVIALPIDESAVILRKQSIFVKIHI